jgi:hypothetical protein
MSFESTESYMHQYAKEVLADWLRSYRDKGIHYFVAQGDRIPSPSANNGVWIEYCFAPSKMEKQLVPFIAWEDYLSPHSPIAAFPYLYVKENESKANVSADFARCVVADIAIRPPVNMAEVDHDLRKLHGCPYVFEIVHKHPVTPEKLEVYRLCGVKAVYEVSAKWVLSQVEPQKEIKCLRHHHVFNYAQVGELGIQSVKSFDLPSPMPDLSCGLDDIWDSAIAVLEPLGTRALFQQQGNLLSLDLESHIARIGIDNRPLFKMAQGRVEHVERAFSKVVGEEVKVSLELIPYLPLSPPVVEDIA